MGAHDRVVTYERVVTYDHVVTYDQVVTYGRVVTFDQVVTYEQVVTYDQVVTEGSESRIWCHESYDRCFFMGPTACPSSVRNSERKRKS